MYEDELLKQVDEEIANVVEVENESINEETIKTIQVTHDWTIFRDTLAMQMFEEYQTR